MSHELLMTYNVKYGEKLPQILDWLASLAPRPDIACFQEFPDPYQNGIASRLQQLGYSFCFGSAIEKQGEIYGQLTAVGLGKTIIKSQVVPFGLNLLEKYGFWVDGERSALITGIASQDRYVQVGNGHWPLIATYGQRLTRTAQLIDAMDPAESAILTGDFNNIHLKREAGRNRLIKDLDVLGFKDSGLAEPTFPFPIPHQLDFVFSRGWELRNARVVDIDKSDHKPVFVEIH